MRLQFLTLSAARLPLLLRNLLCQPLPPACHGPEIQSSGELSARTGVQVQHRSAIAEECPVPLETGLLESRRPSELAAPWLPVSAALLASAGFSVLLSRWLLAGAWDSHEALLRAIIAVTLSLEGFRLAARAASFVIPESGRPDAAMSLLLAAAGLWVAPLAALARLDHPLALPAAVAAGFAAGRIVRRFIPADPAMAEPSSWQPPGFLFLCETAPAARRPAAPWTAAALIHSGAGAALAGWAGAGAALAAAGALAAGWTAAAGLRERRPAIWHARLITAASASAAVIVSLSIVVRVPAPVFSPHSFEGSSKPVRSGVSSGRNLVSGVILIAPAPRNARLQNPPPAPNLPQARPSRISRKTPDWAIPFSGVYWVLPGPTMHPPASSLIVRDTPLGWQFENIDRRAIWMKAVQELPWPVSPSCCRALELTVANADRIEGTVALEVMLISRTGDRPRRVTLGLQPVARAGRTVLRFPWRSAPFSAEFDEILVEFHLAGRRIHRSAQVSIESFRFIR